VTQPLVIRITHWVNVPVLVVMAMSGLQILHAYPYFGPQGEQWTWVPFQGLVTPEWMRAGGWLAGARHLHFLFAWLFVINGSLYALYGFVRGHFHRDLAPTAEQLTPRHLGREIADHARLRFPKGEEARHYNALQKLAYLIVIFVLLPRMLATGLTMSPGIDAGYPFLLDLFGGRQSARSIHFICAWSIVVFVIIHVSMVILSGLWNNMRSMITGRYAIETERGEP